MKVRIVKYLLVGCFFYFDLALADVTTLKVGVVPQFEQRQIFKNWKPILVELEKITNLKFELMGSSKIPEFEKQFTKGAYDIAYMNPYHALKAHQAQRYIPLLRDSNNIKGILVVNKNSTINSLQQLNNKTIAFPSPNALGASLLMRALLNEKYAIKFNPRYVKTHSSVFYHVAKNMAVAGGGVNRTFTQQSFALREKLKIIYRTPEMVSHPIVIHPRVPLKTRDSITKAMVALFKTKRGKQLFKKVPITNLVNASIQDYSSLTQFNLDKYYEE